MDFDHSTLFWMEFLNRYDAGDHFGSDELEEMAFNCDEVEEHRGEVCRRSQLMETIFVVDGRYFLSLGTETFRTTAIMNFTINQKRSSCTSMKKSLRSESGFPGSALMRVLLRRIPDSFWGS